MKTQEQIIEEVTSAFSDNIFPANNISGSNESEEALLLNEVFKDKTDWQNIEPDFLDHAPDGYSSALSFFSDEAFHFYLPAYLIADLKGKLENTDLVFHLCSGLTNKTMDKRVNPLRYNDLTWYELRKEKFSIFTSKEKKVVMDYLNYKITNENNIYKDDVIEAINNYWSK